MGVSARMCSRVGFGAMYTPGCASQQYCLSACWATNDSNNWFKRWERIEQSECGITHSDALRLPRTVCAGTVERGARDARRT